MINNHLRVFNWLLTIFGVGNPHLSGHQKANSYRLLLKLWSFLIVIVIVVCYFISYRRSVRLNIRDDLEQISSLNDMAVGVFVIFANIFDRGNTCEDLYENVNIVLTDIKVEESSIKLLVRKMFTWLSIPAISMTILINLEIVITGPAFVLLSRIPTYLCVVHLIIHMYVLLAALKVVTVKLSEMLLFNDRVINYPDLESSGKAKIFRYIFDPEIKFIQVDYRNYRDIKFLCRLYDRIVTCMHLLEKFHGMQVLLTIWLMFSSAVFGVTLISCNQAKFPWLVIAKSILPFLWCYICCYIQGQMQLEVEQIEIMIIKYLIDYRCDATRKNTLQIFKQLVNTNRLQFTACNLFHLNYSMLLSAIMNIITYSIILIQLFMNQ